MLILPQTVLMNWDNSNKKYFKLKGYIFTKAGDKFEVNVLDLSKGSSILVNCLCDYCNKIINIPYNRYNNLLKNSIVQKTSCYECKSKKIKENNLIKYGVESTNSLTLVQEKKKQTILNKYGVEHISQIPEVKEKKKQVNLGKYGVEHYSQTQEYKDKIKTTNLVRYGDECSSRNNEVKNKLKTTNLERYGCEYTLQNEEVRKKGKITNLEKYGAESYPQTQEYKDRVRIISLEKYGTEYILQNLDVIKKRMQTLYNNGTCRTSSQQLEIYNKLLDLKYNVELNYPVSRCNLDIALFIDDIKIDIEYDGWYWHQDLHKDRKRDEFLKSEGWKILRIRSGNKIPSLEQIREGIFKLVNTDRTFTQIILDDWKEKIC